MFNISGKSLSICCGCSPLRDRSKDEAPSRDGDGSDYRTCVLPGL